MSAIKNCLKAPFVKTLFTTPILAGYGFQIAKILGRSIYQINPIMGAIAGGSAALTHGVLFEGTKKDHSTLSFSLVAKIKLLANAALTFLTTLLISNMYQIPFTPEAFLYLGTASLLSAGVITATAILFIGFSKKVKGS